MPTIQATTSTVLDDSITRKSDGYTAGSCAWDHFRDTVIASSSIPPKGKGNDDAAERAIATLRAKGYTAEDVIAAMRARP